MYYDNPSFEKCKGKNMDEKLLKKPKLLVAKKV